MTYSWIMNSRDRGVVSEEGTGSNGRIFASESKNPC